MGTDVGVLYGPLGGRSRHKQGHKRSRERAVAAPSSIAVLKPHLLYLLVSDTHAVTSDTRPHYEPTTASQNRQVISNPNDGATGERRDKKRSYKLTIARCMPTMRGATPCRAKGRSAGATTNERQNAPTRPSSVLTRTPLLLVDGGQNHRIGRWRPPLVRPAPSVNGAERRSRAQAGTSQGVPSARALAKCRASLCDAPRGAKGSGGGPAAWTRRLLGRRRRIWDRHRLPKRPAMTRKSVLFCAGQG